MQDSRDGAVVLLGAVVGRVFTTETRRGYAATKEAKYLTAQCFMILRSLAENENEALAFTNPMSISRSPSFPMLLAGIQGDRNWTPIKTFAGDGSGVRYPFDCRSIPFSKGTLSAEKFVIPAKAGIGTFSLCPRRLCGESSGDLPRPRKFRIIVVRRTRRRRNTQAAWRKAHGAQHQSEKRE